jgi:hypothetical protein
VRRHGISNDTLGFPKTVVKVRLENRIAIQINSFERVHGDENRTRVGINETAKISQL